MKRLADRSAGADAAEEYVVPKELLDAIAFVSGEEPASKGQALKVKVSDVFPVAAEIKKKEAAAAAERAARPHTGDRMEDGTIYLGRFKNKDGTEKGLVFAADDGGMNLTLDFNKASLYATNPQQLATTMTTGPLPPGCDNDNWASRISCRPCSTIKTRSAGLKKIVRAALTVFLLGITVFNQ